MSSQLATPQAYRQSAVLSASPGQLILELYDGARRFLRQAAESMSERDVERAHNALRRAELIITHLNEVIDDEQGEVSQNLHAIYAIYLSELGQARIRQDPRQVEAVSRMLGQMRQAWQQALSSPTAGQAVAS
ncbi:MAG TPA: flagellar export chaperone FliS [Solirubrobacteraceae bacterium]|jgi:flagellar protein FliS